MREIHDGSSDRRRIQRATSALAGASLLRHAAICTATFAAWAMRRELHVTSDLLWVLGLAALVNAGAARLSDSPRWTWAGRLVSPAVGLVAWAALVLLTGGVSSPMIGGFWLEIVLAALVFAPPTTLLATGAGIAALWVDQCALGLGPSLGRLCLHTGFLLSLGLLAFYASRRWRQEHDALSVEAIALGRRLIELDRELEAARALGQVGERVARLAHSLKNAIHSLRGFVKLMEVPAAGDRTQTQVLGGLRLAIDRLEETARAVLHPCEGGGQSDGPTTASELSRTLDEVVAEMSRIHSGVRWVKAPASDLPGVALPAARLREVLLILTQNAAEASGASGEVVLRVDVVGDLLHLVIQDRGPGFDPPALDALFRPGVTSKPGGSGFGLFLARRLVEAGGGRLTVAAAGQGGGLVSVRLPVSQS
jgi:signal transduction histidine kinase